MVEASGEGGVATTLGPIVGLNREQLGHLKVAVQGTNISRIAYTTLGGQPSGSKPRAPALPPPQKGISPRKPRDPVKSLFLHEVNGQI